MPHPITPSIRLALSALADRLVFGSPDTFSAADAVELLGLLPSVTDRPKGFRWSAKGSLPGKGTAGAAAGVGGVTLPGEQTTFDYDSDGRQIVRAGQWKLRPEGEAIEIVQVGSGPLDDRQAVRLRFEAGQPVGMDLMVQKHIRIWPLGIAWGSYKPWKVPAA